MQMAFPQVREKWMATANTRYYTTTLLRSNAEEWDDRWLASRPQVCVIARQCFLIRRGCPFLPDQNSRSSPLSSIKRNQVVRVAQMST